MTKLTKRPEHSPLPWVRPHGHPSMLTAGHRRPMRSVLASNDRGTIFKRVKPDAEDLANIALVERRVNSGEKADELAKIVAEQFNVVGGPNSVLEMQDYCPKAVKLARQYQAMQEETKP